MLINNDFITENAHWECYPNAITTFLYTKPLVKIFVNKVQKKVSRDREKKLRVFIISFPCGCYQKFFFSFKMYGRIICPNIVKILSKTMFNVYRKEARFKKDILVWSNWTSNVFLTFFFVNWNGACNLLTCLININQLSTRKYYKHRR